MVLWPHSTKQTSLLLRITSLSWSAFAYTISSLHLGTSFPLLDVRALEDIVTLGADEVLELCAAV